MLTEGSLLQASGGDPFYWAMSDALPIVNSNGQPFQYTELWRRYTTSAFGQHQAKQPLRYAAHAYDLENDTMVEDLAGDPHPLEHMEITHNDVAGFMLHAACDPKLPPLEPLSIAVGRFGALMHDTGENTHSDLKRICGGVVGDIPHNQKTPEQKAIEYKVLKEVVSTHHADLPVAFRERAIALICHQPDDEDVFAHDVYEAAHDFGFLRTAAYASHIVASAPDSPRAQHLANLTIEVHANIYAKLQARSQQLPFLGTLLATTFFERGHEIATNLVASEPS
jgi:hypothetical protein